MASDMMHLAIAKKVNKELNMKERDLFLGTLAPDLNAMVHSSRKKAHFFKRGTTNIDLDKFAQKYKRGMKNPFEMGYYIHLYADKIWHEHLISDMFEEDSIRLLNGTILKLDEEERKKIVYNDFTNLSMNIINKYDIDLSLFYMDLNYPKTKIDEIPIKKLNLIVEKVGNLIINSEKKKTVVLDCKNIYKYIDNTAELIIDDLKQRGFIKE